MPRTARIVVPEVPHHITERGNNKQDVFFVEDDRRMYMELLGAQEAKYGLRIEGYCLMNNHVRAIGTPATEDALAKTLGAYPLSIHPVHQSYASPQRSFMAEPI